MPGLAPSLGIVGYLAFFAVSGLLFLFVNLLVGKFVRPSDPHPEKLEIYECGEPTIGSSFVQFDLRFYVVALLFIIFDVEVAFFFPWATVFGKTTNLADERMPVAVATAEGIELTPAARALYQEMGVPEPSVVPQVPATLQEEVGTATINRASVADEVARKGARQLALVTLVDIGVFFGVLLVGFAYVWKRGDLDWVRAVTRSQPRPVPRSTQPGVRDEEPVLSA